MPRQKRRSLPGAILLIALIGSAVVLGVYGNKVHTASSGVTETASPTETFRGAETPVSATPGIGLNETVSTVPTNSSQGST